MNTEAHRIAEFCAGKPLRERREYRVPCPAHGGTNDNLSISVGDTGRTLLHCHSNGCSFDSIVASIPSYLLDENTRTEAVYAPRATPKPVTLEAKPDSRTYDFAREIWSKAAWSDTTDHAYAVKKHLPPYGLMRETTLERDYGKLSKGDRVLVIQMQDENGCFTGVQLINEEGTKCFAGTQGMLILSNELFTKDCIFHIVEGYATATAVRHIFPESFNVPVVAFSKTSLEKVRDLLVGRIEKEYGFTPRTVLHHEEGNIDLWDVVYDPEAREKFKQRRAA
jgi:hypothetical protein